MSVRVREDPRPGAHRDPALARVRTDGRPHAGRPLTRTSDGRGSSEPRPFAFFRLRRNNGPGVKYVQRNALAGKRFRSWEHLNAWLLEWATTVADARVHGTTHEVPRERFAREQLAPLGPLGSRPGVRARARAAPDGGARVHDDRALDVGRARGSRSGDSTLIVLPDSTNWYAVSLLDRTTSRRSFDDATGDERSCSRGCDASSRPVPSVTTSRM